MAVVAVVAAGGSVGAVVVASFWELVVVNWKSMISAAGVFLGFRPRFLGLLSIFGVRVQGFLIHIY